MLNVKHKDGCSCRVGHEVDHRVRCTCGVNVQGKPFSHWQDMADYLVMWELVTAVRRFSAEHASIPQQIAAERLRTMAQQYSPDLLTKINQQLDDQVEGFALLVEAMRKINWTSS